jgi:hypothetical protein
MQSGKRLAQLAVAGVAVGALVTSCGSSSSGSGGKADGNAKIGTDTLTPQALLATSVDKSLAARNAKISFNFKGSAAGKELGFTGDGLVDFVGKKFQMTVTLPPGTGLTGTIEERLIDKVLYLKLPAASPATGGKSWVKIDTSSLGTGNSGLNSLDQNPADILGTLRSVSNSVSKVGTEDVRGVPTTHYRADIDLAKAATASGAGAGLSATTINEYKQALGSSSLPEDVYLDKDGLPRRLSLSIKPQAGSTASSAAVGAIAITIDFFDYGKAETGSIVAPPASEVGSFPTGALPG